MKRYVVFLIIIFCLTGIVYAQSVGGFAGETQKCSGAISDAQNRLKQLEDESKELMFRRSALQRRHNMTKIRRSYFRAEIRKINQAQALNRKNLKQTRLELKSLQYNECR